MIIDMKNKLSAIAVIIILLNLFCTTAFSANTIDVTVTVNYENFEILVESESDIPYTQRVSVIMADSAIVNPTFLDYIRFDEFSDVNESLSAKFVLGNDIPTGSYKFIVTVSGNLSIAGERVIKILSISDAAQAVTNINNANSSNMDTYLSQIAEAVSLDTADYNSNKAAIISLLIGIRDADYNGSFSNLQDVKDGIETINTIRAIKNAPNSAIVKTLLEKNALIFGINLADTDYLKNPDLVCNSFYNMNKSYNNGAGVLNIRDINALHTDALALTMINTSSIDDMETYIKRYAVPLLISSYIADYDRLDKIKIARQLADKNFADIEAIKTEFISAVNLLKNQGGGIVTSPSGNGGGSGGGGSIQSTIKGNIEAPPPAEKVTFSDMAEFSWAKDSIDALSEMNIVNGYSDGQFKGNATVKREEFIKMLVLSLGMYNENSKNEFFDVSADNWAYSYISSGFENGIVNGDDNGNFGMGQEITRQDMAVMVHRASEKTGISYESINDAMNFTDAELISDYAAESVAALQKAGIINGFSDGSFSPKESLSRAQAAKVIFEVLKRK